MSEIPTQTRSNGRHGGSSAAEERRAQAHVRAKKGAFSALTAARVDRLRAEADYLEAPSGARRERFEEACEVERTRRRVFRRRVREMLGESGA